MDLSFDCSIFKAFNGWEMEEMVFVGRFVDDFSHFWWAFYVVRGLGIFARVWGRD